MKTLILLCAAPLALAACSGGASSAPPATQGSALSTLRAGGRYVFSLDESDPAAKIRAKCASDNPGDAAKADACYAAVKTEASNEGITFTNDASGNIVWTSWVVENGVETIDLRAPLAVVEDKGSSVLASFAAKPDGTSAVHVTAAPAAMRFSFEVPDARTVVMVDPQKGRLVFHR